MQYSFSDRISNLHPSAIREILKNSDPNVISLAAGNPAVESFPVAEMKEIADHIFDTASGVAFQYGITEGYPRLRELVMKRQKEKYGIGNENDDIMIISGGTQAMDLSTKVLVNEGGYRSFRRSGVCRRTEHLPFVCGPIWSAFRWKTTEWISRRLRRH